MLVKRNIVCVSDSATLRMGCRDFFRHTRQRDAKENREHGHLQNLVIADGLDDIFRENVQHENRPT